MLIKCSECQKEISNKADKCPHCGCPLERANNYSVQTIPVPVQTAPVQIQTVELTSKNIKRQTIYALLLLFISVIFISMQNPIGVIGLVISLIWLLINSFRQWWHHG